jgi:hypothetical protein
LVDAAARLIRAHGHPESTVHYGNDLRSPRHRGTH